VAIGLERLDEVPTDEPTAPCDDDQPCLHWARP
jgi:hypothetical protein